MKKLFSLLIFFIAFSINAQIVTNVDKLRINEITEMQEAGKVLVIDSNNLVQWVSEDKITPDLSDYYTKIDVDAILEDYYDKGEVDALLSDIDLSNYYTKNEADGRFALRSRSITGTGGLTGGGDLTANRTLDLSSSTKSDIAKGVTAHGWGNHASAGYATEEFVGNAIDDIEIGGRNLLIGTSEEWKSGTITGYNIYPYGGGPSSPTITDVEEGESYVFSIRVRQDNQRARLHVKFFNETGSSVGNIFSEFIDSEDEGRLYLAFTVPENAVSFFIAIRREFNDNESTIVEYKKAKLEKSNKATDWTPAPEDQVTDFLQEDEDALDYLKNRELIALKADLSDYYTKNESLNQFVGLSGVQDIADTKTFLASPVVPNGTISSHAVNLGQLDALESPFEVVDVTQQAYSDIAIVVKDFDNIANGMTYQEGAIDFGVSRDSIHEMGLYSFKTGFDNTVLAPLSFVTGQNNTITGAAGVSFGFNNFISGAGGVSFGENNEVTGAYSTSLGLGLISNNFASLVIGRYSTGGTSQTGWLSGSPIFKVGNGSSASNRKNAYTLYNDGRSEQEKDMEVTTIGQGFVLKSPDGTRWRITVDNNGALSAEQL